MEGSGKGRRHFPPVPRRVKTSLSVKAVNQVSQGVRASRYHFKAHTPEVVFSIILFSIYQKY